MGKIPDYKSLNAYGDRLTSQLQAAVGAGVTRNNATIGGFVEHCYHHCTTTTLWTEAPKLGPEKLAAAGAFSRWYETLLPTRSGLPSLPRRPPVGDQILWQSGALPCRACGCPNATLCPGYPSCNGSATGADADERSATRT